MTDSDQEQKVSPASLFSACRWSEGEARFLTVLGSAFHLSAASSPWARAGAPTGPLPLPQHAETSPVSAGPPQPPCPPVPHPVPQAGQTPAASASHPRPTEGGVLSKRVSP